MPTTAYQAMLFELAATRDVRGTRHWEKVVDIVESEDLSVVAEVIGSWLDGPFLKVELRHLEIGFGDETDVVELATLIGGDL